MRRFLLAAVVLPSAAILLSAAMPRPASACWDGTRIETPRLMMMGPDARWRPERAREVAKWAPRVDALLAEIDLSAAIYWDVIELSDGTHIPIRHQSLERAFIEIARHRGVSRDVRRRALAAPRGLTVQVAATRDRARADALAARLNDENHPDGPAGAHGMYEAGGFPSVNDTAHVVTELDASGREVHRVIVGTFLDRAEAERVAAEVAQRSGSLAFARRL